MQNITAKSLFIRCKKLTGINMHSNLSMHKRGLGFMIFFNVCFYLFLLTASDLTHVIFNTLKFYKRRHQ